MIIRRYINGKKVEVEVNTIPTPPTQENTTPVPPQAPTYTPPPPPPTRRGCGCGRK